MQALFERMQLGMVDRVGDLMRVAREDPKSAIEQGLAGGILLMGLHESLLETYTTALEDLESG